ncbi:MAG TPA: hypothetical protein VLA49_19270 [Anaerolineales bacterium]|nr:hypothetical protein [Anaerolineales bacterium]
MKKDSPRRHRLILAAPIYPDQTSQTNGLLLAESLRAFAGDLAQAPVWFFSPEDGDDLSPAFESRLLGLDVNLIRIDMEAEILRFPLGAEACLAAGAEAALEDQASLLAWLGANTVVLGAPVDFLLPENKRLGVRPVHHLLIGSRLDQPLDPFWGQIYSYCRVPAGHIFPMTTHIDAVEIRPYFNAGSLLVRPEEGLLRSWRQAFLEIYHQPAMQAFYRSDAMYKIFIHQAVLAGVILAAYSPAQIHTLPPTYNYPLHLYEEDITGTRPGCLEELVTFRHEGFYQDAHWMEEMPAGEPLKRWLAERLA